MTTDPSSANKYTGKKYFVGGNWKCNGTIESVNALCTGLIKTQIFDNVDVIVAPVAIHISLVQNLLSSSLIQVSSQNVSRTGTGAFTGEITAAQLVDINVQWTIVGHSERRAMFGDTDEIITDKIRIALENRLQVIACFGEQLVDRKAGNVVQVCTKHLTSIAAGVANIADWKNIVLAYEPVWAIGTGVACEPNTAQETIKMCRYAILIFIISNDCLFILHKQRFHSR